LNTFELCVLIYTHTLILIRI